jgi:hypothetical protein
MARGDLQIAQQLLNRSMELSGIFEEVSELGNKLSGLLDDLDYPQEVSEFQTLIRLLRNSVAHFGIQTNSRTGMIEALILSNRNRGQINWQILIPIHELREFVEWFARGIIDSSLLDRPIEEIKVA